MTPDLTKLCEEAEAEALAAQGMRFHALLRFPGGPKPSAEECQCALAWFGAHFPTVVAALREAQADITHWITVADGVAHDPRCRNNAATGGEGDPCLRCRLEQAQADCERLREALRAVEPAMLTASRVNVENERLREFAGRLLRVHEDRDAATARLIVESAARAALETKR